MQKVHFQSDRIRLAGELHASAPESSLAVILCHGAFEFQEHWRSFAAHFQQQGLSSFSFDFPGHGQSQGTPSLVNLRLWAYAIRDAISYLESRGFKRLALVGWDIGGSAALLTAAHDQRLVCTAVLAAPVLLVPSLAERVAYGLVSGAAQIVRAVRKKPLTLSRLNELESLEMACDEEVNVRYRSDARVRAGYRAVPIPESLHSVWMDIRGALEKIRTPTLILHGAQDRVIDTEQSRMLHEKLSGPKSLHFFDDSGHALHLDREKEAVFTRLASWITRHG